MGLSNSSELSASFAIGTFYRIALFGGGFLLLDGGSHQFTGPEPTAAFGTRRVGEVFVDVMPETVQCAHFNLLIF
jgi:hypothetical protein